MFGYVYLGMGLLTMALATAADLRKGEPWAEAWWWLIVWPVELMWPLAICTYIAEILDGPYRPRHRVEYF